MVWDFLRKRRVGYKRFWNKVGDQQSLEIETFFHSVAAGLWISIRSFWVFSASFSCEESESCLWPSVTVVNYGVCIQVVSRTVRSWVHKYIAVDLFNIALARYSWGTTNHYSFLRSTCSLVLTFSSAAPTPKTVVAQNVLNNITNFGHNILYFVWRGIEQFVNMVVLQ